MCLLAIGPAVAETCASRYSDLDQHPEFTAFKALLGERREAGLINATQGSFVRLEVHDDQLSVTLFSTGLFDLIAIRRESALRLCESDGQLTLEAFGRRDHLVLGPDGQVKFGEGGARFQFKLGEMTPLLKRVHQRSLASIPLKTQ